MCATPGALCDPDDRQLQELHDRRLLYQRPPFRGDDTRDAENAEIAYNTVENYRCDVFRMYQSNINVRVHHNKIWKSNVNLTWQKDANRHPDGQPARLHLSERAPRTASPSRTISSRHRRRAATCMADVMPASGSRRTATPPRPMPTRTSRCGATSSRAPIAETIAFGAVQGVTVPEQNKMLRAPGKAPRRFADFYTPQVYFIDACPNDNVVIRNNAWPLIGGQTVLKYGPGEATRIRTASRSAARVRQVGQYRRGDGRSGRLGRYRRRQGRVGQYAAALTGGRPPRDPVAARDDGTKRAPGSQGPGLWG